ncbi:MAG: hypothetical protein U0946_06070, partial [Patescibacteria group bacterium]|nr:hypothetical protein [Patescibacteria group bacterium]
RDHCFVPYGKWFTGQNKMNVFYVWYRTSERRLKRVELETLLLVEERRKVTRESTISLYGRHYYVPPGYIGCRIWVQIKGNKLYLEANGKIFHSARLRF